ncbi:AI-2E family transporter [Curtobacterium sp. MCPF17_003]|uniref:AI-2E family transporter n=1 Tax=Curtobacterium sp. MCPF17_003 TaxID=2175637 RepID=UPI000D91B935|nr:AI-2E family transporter [Curtobacterium sp. MCPF17_003]PYY64638.1 AI-2E family transporter [Curtobacterium sp. MCPF17_003]
MTDHGERRTATTTFAVVAGVVLGVAGVKALSWLVAPCLLAVVIVVLTRPLSRRLGARGVPVSVGIAAAFVTGLGMMVVLVAVVTFAAVRLTTVVRAYRSDLETLVLRAHRVLTEAGLTDAQSHSLTDVITPDRLLRWSAAVAPSLVSVGATVVFFLGLLLFLSIEATQVDQRLAGIRRARPAIAAALTDSARLTRRYFAVTAVLAVVVGALDAVLLAALGVPYPVLWGVLAAVCNFIPYVGFVIGLVPPALIALLDSGPEVAIVIVIVYVVLNSVVTTIVPAKVVGDVVGISMSATVVSLVFWAWVLGPIGSVLAVPCTLVVKGVLVDADPRARFLAPLLNSRKKNTSEQRAR